MTEFNLDEFVAAAEAEVLGPVINDEEELDRFIEDTKNRLLQEKMLKAALRKREKETDELIDANFEALTAGGGIEAGKLAKKVLSLARGQAELATHNPPGLREAPDKRRRR